MEESDVSREPVEAPGSAEAATPDLPTHSEDGVDLTLIRWMLSLTPTQRLEMLEQFVDSILRLRRGLS